MPTTSPIATAFVPVQPAESNRVLRAIAEEAYTEYADQGQGGQSFDRLHERGGFGALELASYLFARIKRLERALAKERGNS